MKTIGKKLMSAVMALMLLVIGAVTVCNGITADKADALAPEYGETQSDKVIYYFGDSSPAYPSIMEAYSDYEVIYDIKWFITEQGLKYLLYTGYFWGFDQDADVIVVLEIKCTKLTSETVSALSECLYLQGCKVLFFTPYADDYGMIEYCEKVEKCNFDRFYKFLRNSFRSMGHYSLTYNSFGDKLTNNTVLLLDERFIFSDGQKNYNFAQMCINSPTFCRILLYMYYGWEGNDCDLYEEELYQQIWSWYQNNILKDLPKSNLNYFEGDTDLGSYITNWEYIDENEFLYDTLWSSKVNDYISKFEEAYENYYSGILSALNNKNIRLIVHESYNTFVNILTSNPDAVGFDTKEFSNYEYFMEYFSANRYFSMDKYPMLPEVWDFLYYFQDAVKSGNIVTIAINTLPVYLWYEEPLDLDGYEGLEVNTAETLQDQFNDEDDLRAPDLFAAALGSVINP